MSKPRPRARWAVLTACVAVLTSACERSTGLTAPTVPPTVPSTTPVASDSGDDSGSEGGSASPPSPSSTTGTTGSDDTGSEGTAAPTSIVTAPTGSLADVAEVGVPGLDSDDVFCASWSRFAGSFQVVAVTAAFGSGPPEELAALEVAAAPTVTTAYHDLIEHWPDELASEADLVADEFLGPFARRLDAADRALRDVGADDATIRVIEQAWLDGLAQRDPATPEFVVDLPDETWAVIDDAAAAFAAQRVPFAQDPTLVTEVETPLTSEYLAVSCPDQGTLSGQEVETP